LDTLCSQAYGAKLFYLMGCYLNQARVILCLVFIPVFFILFFLEDLLLFIGQDPVTAYHSGRFALGVIPGALFFYQIEVQRRFLQAQGVYIFPVLCVIIVTALHPLWVYIFFLVCDWGAFGIGFSLSISNFLTFVIGTFIAMRQSAKGTFFMINSDSFKGWKEFFAIAIPSCLMSCLETWNYQIIAIMTGYLSKDQFESNIILNNISIIISMYPFGLNIASSNIVGKFVGRFSIMATKITCKFIFIYTIMLSTIVMSILAIVRPWIPYIFTSDENLASIVKVLIVYQLFFAFFDFLTTTYGGIFRGFGLQTWIAMANFVCFYIISIPLCYLLTYTFDFGIYGTRISYIIVTLCLNLLYTAIYKYKVDFYAICSDSVVRLQRDSVVISKSPKDEILIDRYSNL